MPWLHYPGRPNEPTFFACCQSKPCHTRAVVEGFEWGRGLFMGKENEKCTYCGKVVEMEVEDWWEKSQVPK